MTSGLNLRAIGIPSSTSLSREQDGGDFGVAQPDTPLTPSTHTPSVVTLSSRDPRRSWRVEIGNDGDTSTAITSFFIAYKRNSKREG